MTPLDDASTDAAQQDHRGLGLVTAFLPAPHLAGRTPLSGAEGPLGCSEEVSRQASHIEVCAGRRSREGRLRHSRHQVTHPVHRLHVRAQRLVERHRTIVAPASDIAIPLRDESQQRGKGHNWSRWPFPFRHSGRALSADGASTDAAKIIAAVAPFAHFTSACDDSRWNGDRSAKIPSNRYAVRLEVVCWSRTYGRPQR